MYVQSLDYLRDFDHERDAAEEHEEENDVEKNPRLIIVFLSFLVLGEAKTCCFLFSNYISISVY